VYQFPTDTILSCLWSCITSSVPVAFSADDTQTCEEQSTCTVGLETIRSISFFDAIITESPKCDNILERVEIRISSEWKVNGSGDYVLPLLPINQDLSVQSWHLVYWRNTMAISKIMTRTPVHSSHRSIFLPQALGVGYFESILHCYAVAGHVCVSQRTWIWLPLLLLLRSKLT
jgi:hypothetical protein